MADINLNNLDGIPFGNSTGRPSSPALGQPYFNGEVGRLELYTSGGWQNITQETPSVVSITGVARQSTTSTITINGTNYASGANAFVVGTDGVEVPANSVTLVSAVQMTAVLPALSVAYEPYDVKVINPSNLYGILYEALNVDATPVWTTGSGSLGTYIEQSAMSIQVSATDVSEASSSPLIYSISSGALPTGLSISSSTGVISGTPANISSTTTYNFTVNAYDGQDNVTRNFSITITDRAPIWVTAATLPTFTRSVEYSTTLAATTDDVAEIVYSLFSGALPTGLSLNTSSGVISGTPSSSTNATFTIRATEPGSGIFADRQFTMGNTVPSWTTSSPLPIFTRNAAYSTTVVATDDSGVAPTYSLFSGSLPTGLSLNSTSGVISGTASSSSPASFTLRATDLNGGYADRAFTMANVGPTWSTSGTISTIANGSAYSYQLVATDDSGVAPSYSIASGTLPTGISVSSSGLISGTTTAITGSMGALSITFRATDANSIFTDQTLSIPTQIYEFSSFTFTNAGVVGSSGPSLAQIRSAYSGTAWTQNSAYLNMTTNGYQEWTVPATGSYTIEARGAAGGDGSPSVFSSTGQDRGFNTNFAGGYGAGMKGTFSLTVGDVYVIVVGQRGRTGTGNVNTAGGGGGGSFVWKKSDLALAVAAGGGGGSQCNSNYWASAGSYIHATTSTTGQTSGAGRPGGSNGGAGTSENNGVTGYNGSGGAGWLGEPAYSAGTPARSRTNGFLGGVPNNNGTFGGFGGGGAPGDDGRIDYSHGSPGGGGYSGGGGASYPDAGGGGGSYNAGSNQVNTPRVVANAHGSVIITKI